MHFNRRHFLAGSAGAATAGWLRSLQAAAVVADSPYGPLGTPDANGVALPEGLVDGDRKWIAQRLGDEASQITRVLYGGSVKPDNAKQLMALDTVDGLLVGGASLLAETFLPIIEYDA